MASVNPGHVGFFERAGNLPAQPDYTNIFRTVSDGQTVESFPWMIPAQRQPNWPWITEERIPEGDLRAPGESEIEPLAEASLIGYTDGRALEVPEIFTFPDEQVRQEILADIVVGEPSGLRPEYQGPPNPDPIIVQLGALGISGGIENPQLAAVTQNPPPPQPPEMLSPIPPR